MGDARGKTPPEDGDDEIAVFRFAAPGAKIGDDAAPAIGVAAGSAAPRGGAGFLGTSSIFKQDDIVDRRFGDASEGSIFVDAREDAFACSIVFRVSTFAERETESAPVRRSARNSARYRISDNLDSCNPPTAPPRDSRAVSPVKLRTITTRSSLPRHRRCLARRRRVVEE